MLKEIYVQGVVFYANDDEEIYTDCNHFPHSIA